MSDAITIRTTKFGFWPGEAERADSEVPDAGDAEGEEEGAGDTGDKVATEALTVSAGVLLDLLHSHTPVGMVLFSRRRNFWNAGCKPFQGRFQAGGARFAF